MTTVAKASAAEPAAPTALREVVVSDRQTLWEAAREMADYRELLIFLARRDVTIRYRQTAFGAAWAVLQPLITMLIFTTLFTRVVSVQTYGLPAPVFYYSALLPWIYFSGALRSSSISLVVNAQIIRKVYFPRLILPASAALVGLVDLAVGFVVMLLLLGYYGMLSWHLVLWVPLTVLVALFVFGAGCLLAAINVKYRDVGHALPFLIQIWLFVTPIIYSSNSVPARYRLLVWLNPMAGYIEAFRAASRAAPLPWTALGIAAGVTLVSLVVGIAYFRRAEGQFTDIV
ncbi:MAG: ABC transporter permease [Gemmatimonadales bacterium]